MASPPFRSQGSVYRLDGTNHTDVPNAAGAVSGDLLVMAMFTIFSDQVNNAVANGWTQVQDYDPNNVNFSQYSLFWRIATGSEPSTYPVVISGGGGAQNLADAQIFCYQGPIATTQINASTQANGTTSTNVSIPSLTTTVNDTMIFSLYGDTALNGSGTWGSAPTGMTQRTTTTSFAIADMAMPTAGATGVLTASHATSAPWVALIMAIAAPAAADTTKPTLVSAAVSNSTPTVVTLTMSEAMDTGFVPAASAFSVSGHTVNTIGVSGSTITITCSAAFVNGETARVVGYTQPGANNARDIAGNLLDNFSSQAITNNVLPADTTKPTASFAAVANAAPTLVNITMSEAMDTGFLPAASSVTVSGHTVSTLAWASSTILCATVSSAFVFGEAARTVAYTQPGANNARDAAGNLLDNFTGLAVTNNVAATDTTPPAFSSAQVTTAAPNQIVITMNETLAASTPAASAFTPSGGRTATAVTRSGATITVTVDTPYAYGDSINVSYTQPGSNKLQDAAGNLTVSFGPSTVVNNIAPLGSLSIKLVNNTIDPVTRAATAALRISEGNWTSWATSITSFGTPVGTVHTGLSTDASGNLVVSDAAYVSGTWYIQHYGNTVTGYHGWQKVQAA